jgi:hypothetical protein
MRKRRSMARCHSDKTFRFIRVCYEDLLPVCWIGQSKLSRLEIYSREILYFHSLYLKNHMNGALSASSK